MALDGLNLMWHSDLVVSGGGTMNREAAALGVPVYSIFRGRIGAVDRHLSEEGRLVLVDSTENVDDQIRLVRRLRRPLREVTSKQTLHRIVDTIEEIAAAATT
jgi:predicted glycosyltransferase